MASRCTNQRAVIAAAAAGGLLMGLSGLIYRAVAAPAIKAPLDPNALAHFPMQIGEWTGRDIPVDAYIEAVIDADAYVSRSYTRQNGLESIGLYLPCGTDAPALLQHVPENCYVGAGWTLVNRRPKALALADGRQLPCSTVEFARSGLDKRRLLLLHFLVVDGEYFTTFSAVAKAKGWRHFASVDYAAQAQIIASAGDIPLDAAAKRVTDFALDLAPVIEKFFEDIETTAGGGDVLAVR